MLLRNMQKRFAQLAAGETPKILVTGSLGQVGCAQMGQLRERYGNDSVIASDIVMPQAHYRDGPFTYADVTKYNTLATIAVDHNANWVVHNSSIQSISAEQDPSKAMDIHITGIRNILELAKNLELRVFAPSSIAVFSPESGSDNIPDMAPNRPKSVYGVTKCFTENIGVYYSKKYGVDFRCLRYPGVVSTLTEGKSPVLRSYKETTDDFVTMSLHAYKRGEPYKCGVDADKQLPFIFIDDAISASLSLLSADVEKLTRRVYNVQGCCFTPRMFEAEVQKHLPDFKLSYGADLKTKLSADWPNSVDDSAFRSDFDWAPAYDLPKIVKTMLERMDIKH